MKRLISGSHAAAGRAREGASLWLFHRSEHGNHRYPARCELIAHRESTGRLVPTPIYHHNMDRPGGRRAERARIKAQAFWARSGGSDQRSLPQARCPKAPFITPIPIRSESVINVMARLH
jgi:hypothetical protein